MPELSVEEQYELEFAIGNNVLQEMSEEDNSAELTIDIDNEGIHFNLVSDTRPIIVPGEDLTESIVNFVTAHERAQTRFSSAVYLFNKKPDGNWQLQVNYGY